MNLIAHYTDNLIEAGCDEAGRGCLAGPVVVVLRVVLLPTCPTDSVVLRVVLLMYVVLRVN